MKNVGRFAGLDIALPEGLLGVSGANGSGKSTLVQSIELALFADGSRDLAGCLSPWADRLEIELVFSHAGEMYRVRRGYVGGSRGKATLDFEREGPGWHVEPDEYGDPMQVQSHPEWEPLTRESTSATQALINAILGLSRRTFGASAFLAQGSAGAFPEATASDRKAILGEILDPRDFWPKVANQALAERKITETKVAIAQGRIADGLAQIEALPDLKVQHHDGTIEHASCIVVVTAREDEVATAQASLTEAQTAAERARTLTAERDAARQTLLRANDDLQGALAATERIRAGKDELIDLLVDSQPIEQLETKVEEQRRMTEARKEALRQKDNAHRERNDLLANIERVAQEGIADKERHAALVLQADELEQHPHEEHNCETCGQVLPDDARRKVIDGLRAKAYEALLAAQARMQSIETIEVSAADMLAAIEAFAIPEVPTDDYAGQLAEARKTEARRIELGVLIKGYEEKASRLDELRQVHEAAKADLDAKSAAIFYVEEVDTTQLGDALTLRKYQLENARKSLSEIQQRQARLEQQIETLTQVASNVEATQAEIADTQKQIDLLKLAERAFGRDGIPALIVESVIGVIEAETNRLLEAMPTSDGETFRVELRTQRALKTADHLKETLDIVVYDRDGERPYETYSGGEQARLNICLRIALALLLADRRGAESRLLVVDELEYLDALGQEQLIDVIQSVSHRFDRTIVVSHHPGIRDAFDNTLRIVKDDGVSRVAPSDEGGMMIA